MYLVCQTYSCQQTYPASDYRPTDRDVKCPDCGGYIITPSGKVQLSMNPHVIPVLSPEEARSAEARSEEVDLGQSRSKEARLGRGELFEVVIHDGIMFVYEDPDSMSRIREVEVCCVYYGSSEDYPEEQWLLKGYDIDRRREYIFALNKMSNVRKVWNAQI